MSSTRHRRADANRFAVDSETANPHRSTRLTVEMLTSAAAASPICESPRAMRRSRSRLAVLIVVIPSPICYNCPMSWVAQVKAAKSIGCDRKTIGRWLRDGKLTSDPRGRVLLSDVERVATQKGKQGRQIGSGGTRRDAEIRLMAHVLGMVQADKDTATITKFFRSSHNLPGKLRALEPHPLETVLRPLLAKQASSTIPVLTARLVLDALRGVPPSDRPIKPTKTDREEMRSLLEKLPDAQYTGKPYDKWSREERALGRRVTSEVFETIYARRRIGLIESRERKTPYKLGDLLLCSRRMACYWHKITNEHYAQFQIQLRLVLKPPESPGRLKAAGTFDDSLREYLDELNRNVQLEPPKPELANPKRQRVFADDVASRNKRSAAAQTRKFRDVQNEGLRQRRGE